MHTSIALGLMKRLKRTNEWREEKWRRKRSVWRKRIEVGAGWGRWGGEVRAAEWHSVNCGLMKVLIMELVTFGPVTVAVALIDLLWSVTRRHYWSVPRSCSSCRQDGMHKHHRLLLLHLGEPRLLKYQQHLLRGGGPCLCTQSSPLIAPIKAVIE